MKNLLIITNGYIEYDKIEKYLNNKEFKIKILPLQINDKLKLNNFKDFLIDESTYFNNDSHQYLLEKSENIRNIIRDALIIKYNQNSIYSLRIWFSNLFLKEFVNFKLKIIYSIIKVIEIYNFKDAIFMSPDEYFNNEIIKFIFDSKKIPLEIFTTKISKKKYKKKLNYLLPQLNNFLFNLKSNVLITSKNYNCYEIAKNNINNNSKIFILSENTSITSSLKNFFFNKLRTIIVIPIMLKKISYKFNNDHFKKNFPEILNFNFCNIFEKKLIELYESKFEQTLKKCEFLSNLFTNQSPRAIFSTDSDYINGFIGEYSYLFNFHSFCITHGTHTFPKNNNEFLYQKEIGENVILNSYPYIISQSIFCDKFLEKFTLNSKIIKTKPLVYNFGNFSPPFNKTILHASTTKTENSYKFWGVETIEEYISSIVDVHEVTQSQGFKLIVKPHPSLKKILTLQELQNLLDIDDIHFTDNNFNQCLKLSDILVSFSSTTIEETLYNKKPVILYDRNNRYNHLDAQELNFQKNIKYSQPYFYINNIKILNENLPIIYNLHKENKFEYKDIFLGHTNSLDISKI